MSLDGWKFTQHTLAIQHNDQPNEDTWVNFSTYQLSFSFIANLLCKIDQVTKTIYRFVLQLRPRKTWSMLSSLCFRMLCRAKEDRFLLGHQIWQVYEPQSSSLLHTGRKCQGSELLTSTICQTQQHREVHIALRSH